MIYNDQLVSLIIWVFFGISLRTEKVALIWTHRYFNNHYVFSTCEYLLVFNSDNRICGIFFNNIFIC